jgi:hypothetical protein
MAELHPLVIVLIAVLGSLAIVAVGCAIHRVLKREQYQQYPIQPVGDEQRAYMHEVCMRTKEEATGGSRWGSRPNPARSGSKSSYFGYSHA